MDTFNSTNRRAPPKRLGEALHKVRLFPSLLHLLDAVDDPHVALGPLEDVRDVCQPCLLVPQDLERKGTSDKVIHMNATELGLT